ncbi:hypothetical protein PY254_01145 [Rhodanobacter sp. AS-Z3]|uniref:hypothetical protein n=1 Tax=Rhodanobacter sp. AS-Z3 TaxID=3031330 RepID=UPI00247A9483|nr:hypothetical protein [Rhodanobacter sp. AS-Z3]WEN15316.1 hypothetical protein PY254_01145 [Rhodanobacter sp. AS-Z3]
MSSLSQSIVDFIASLQPLYTCQHADGRECALSLLDGTLILPIDETHSEEEGWVAVYWQGDCQRHSEVPGSQLASVAIWRYIELHATYADAAERAELREQLSLRFMESTGISLGRQLALAA